MATTGPKTFHFRRSHRVRLIVRLLVALGVLLLLIAGTVFAVKMQKKMKRLFHDIDALQLSQSQSASVQSELNASLRREIEGLKSTVKSKGQNEETIFVQLAELKAAQAASRRDIDRLTLVNKGYEVSLQELTDRYVQLKQTNEELARNVKVIEQVGSQAISEIKAELIKKVDSVSFREQVVKVVEEVLQEKLQAEFNRMFEEKKELFHPKKELEGNVGFVKALDAQSKLTNPYPEVEKIMGEKQEVKVDKSTDPFYISDASDSDVSTSSEEEILKKRQEAIDLRVAELIKLFNSKDGEDDMPQEDQKADQEKIEKLKQLDPFYIEDVPVEPKVEAKREEAPKAPEVPHPDDPFYIEDTDDIFVASDSGSNDDSNWKQEYMDKAKDLLEKTKSGFQSAEKYVKDHIPTASKKMKEIGKEIEEKARKLNTEVKHQAEKLAEKAKKVSKTILSLFNM